MSQPRKNAVLDYLRKVNKINTHEASFEGIKIASKEVVSYPFLNLTKIKKANLIERMKLKSPYKNIVLHNLKSPKCYYPTGRFFSTQKNKRGFENPSHSLNNSQVLSQGENLRSLKYQSSREDPNESRESVEEMSKIIKQDDKILWRKLEEENESLDDSEFIKSNKETIIKSISKRASPKVTENMLEKLKTMRNIK